jgi:hypothetical protein
MARDRDDERDDDDDRPARRRDDRDDDDYDDRPARRRRRRDDDDDGPRKSGMDGFFGNTALAIILSIVFLCFCSPAGIILGGIGMGTCTRQETKRNAMIMLILGIVGLILGIVSTVIRLNMPNAGGRF